MNLDSVRQFCLALPHSTEMVQWEDHLLMKVGGKMFVILALEPGGPVMSLKTTPERYYELLEIDGIRPASHNLWKYNWISCERYDVLRDSEMRDLLQGSYDLVYAGLSRKLRMQLEGGAETGNKQLHPPSSGGRSTRPTAAQKTASSAKSVTAKKNSRRK